MSFMSDDKGALSLFAEPKDVLPDGIDITPKQDGGIYKIIEKQGEGEETPGYGDKVSVHYNATLVDGSEVESSHQAAQMFEYVIGEGNLAEACDIGLTTMKLYEKAIFACRRDYTTNVKDDEIPMDATSMIHVELCKWKREDISPLGDESMLRKVIERGVGKETPQDGSTVTAHIIGIYDDSVFDDRVVTFSLGEGIEHDIVDGVEHAISRFTLKERSKIYMTAPHVFGEQGCPERNIPPNSDVEYEITLNDFEQVKAYSSMVAVEKLTYAGQAKGKGNNYFKSGHYKRAIRFYQRAVRILTIDTSKAFDGDAEKNQAESILLACYLNQGQCNLKLRNYSDVIENCGHALKISACSEKAYYRRGQAYLSRGDLEEALLDFKKVIKLDPENKPAANQLSITQRQIQVHREKQKLLYTKMFSGVTEPEPETVGNAESKNDTENDTESEDKNEA